MKKLLLSLTLATVGFAPNVFAEVSLFTRLSTQERQHLLNEARQKSEPLRLTLNHSPLHKAIEEQDSLPIDIQPEGKEYLYSRSSAGFWTFFGSTYISEWENSGVMVIEGADGLYYIGEPYSGLQTGTWLKCRKEGERLIATLPQPIYTEYYGETGYICYAKRLKAKYENQEEVTYVPSENQEISFIIGEGNSIKLELDEDFDETSEFAPEILGLVDEDDFWLGVGDWRQTYEIFNETSQTPPSDLKAEKWAISSGMYGYNIQVGIEGDNIWIQGFDTGLPQAWVKGTIDGDKAIFKSGQYLGFNPANSSFEYFFTASIESVWDEFFEEYLNTYVPMPEVAMEYSSSDKLLKVPDNQAIMVNTMPDEINYTSSEFTSPTLRFQPDTFDFTPMDPVLTYWLPYDDGRGYAALYFDLANITNEGYTLDENNLYYKFYVDLEEYTFEPDEYEGLTEPTVMIPYTFNNHYTIFRQMTIGHGVYVFIEGFDNLGVRLIYKDGETEYPSYLVYFTPTGIESTFDTIKEVSHEVFYNLSGNKVLNPDKGIYVKVTTFTDGTQKISKTIIK